MFGCIIKTNTCLQRQGGVYILDYKEQYIEKIILMVQEAKDDTDYLRAVYTFAKNYPHKVKKEKE